MLKQIAITSVFSLALIFMAGSASADNITIQNPSFESHAALTNSCAGPETCMYNSSAMSGWTLSGSGGSFEPSSAYFNLPLPNGDFLAYSNGGSFSQTLTGTSEVANSVYTLSVWVGNRKDPGNDTSFSIALDLGATQLCSFGDLTSNIGSGGFVDETCSFTTNSFVSPGDLSIVLTGAGTQVNFDDVTLTRSSVPEPGTLALASLGSLFALLLVSYSKRRHSAVARLI